MRRLPPPLRAAAAAGLLLSAGLALAQAPPAPDNALAALQSAFAGAVAPGAEADLYRELFATILQRVQRSYATDIEPDKLATAARQEIEAQPAAAADPRALFTKAMNAALRGLDPYSRYLDARALGAEREAWRGSFGGVGLEVESGDGVVRIVASMPGTPAARAGLRPGDLIVRIDDQPLAGVPLAEAIARMRGEPGTPVVITVRRTGTEDFTLSLTRDTIRRQAVRWNMEGEVLVLQVSGFTGAVAAGVRQAITEATAGHSPRGVVLDLRGNPGGLLREAVLTADTFLDKGEIVTIKGRTPGAQRTWTADAEEMLAGVPMAVLIDRRSASASELVAAALQDHGRAIVLGQRSFGKGTVQTTFMLGDDARGALKLTSSYYHRPAGPTVQKTGVLPDIELAAAVADDRDRGQLEVLPQARVDPVQCSAVYQAPDPALGCAVAYLQAGNVQRFMASLGL